MPAKTHPQAVPKPAPTSEATIDDICPPGAPVNPAWLNFFAEVRRHGAQIEARKAQQEAPQNEQAITQAEAA